MESSLVVVRFLILLMIITATISTEMTNELDEDFPNERNALVHFRDILNSTANLHSNWTGPPCQRNTSRWAGIGCTNGRVTRLVLEGLNITGSIPQTLLQNLTFLSKLSLRNNSIRGPLPDVSRLMNLRFLFLSRNLFSGSIPISYANNLPKLSKLELQQNHLQGSIPPFDQQTLVGFNVSDNQLNGSIPETPVLERFSARSFDNNPNLCGKPLDVQCPIIPSRKGRNKGVFKLWSIAVIAAAVALVPFFIIIIFLCYYRRNQKKEDNNRRHKSGDEAFSEKKSSLWSSESADDPDRINSVLEFFDRNGSRRQRRPVFDLDDLLRGSAEVIGRGKLGTTYKAAVECGGGGSTVTVAVKRLRKDMNIDLRKKEFVQQMHLLGNLRHENLVQIISYYYSKEEKLLISEYVSHGNLFQLLHENRGIGRQPVNWRTRLSIIHGIAKGLNFLHNSFPSSSHKVPPPHANLKSTNVLLLLFHHENNNNNSSQYYYSCKLSDYGFLPLLPSRKSSWERLASSRSPEFCSGKKVTARTDVYCFGIVVLEIITGKTPTDDHDLSEWVRKVVNTDWSTDILDVEIVSEKEGYDEMLKLTKIALECTDIVPENRPKMCEIMTRIEEVLETNY